MRQDVVEEPARRLPFETADLQGVNGRFAAQVPEVFLPRRGMLCDPIERETVFRMGKRRAVFEEVMHLTGEKTSGAPVAAAVDEAAHGHDHDEALVVVLLDGDVLPGESAGK